jgi:hypothetical protein
MLHNILPSLVQQPVLQQPEQGNFNIFGQNQSKKIFMTIFLN